MQGGVVPINPMSKDAEVAFIQSDTNARLLICGSEVCEYALPLLLRGNLEHIVVTNYDDMCDLSYDLKLPASVVARDPNVMRKMGLSIWQDVIMAAFPATPVNATARILPLSPTVPAQREIPKAACILMPRLWPLLWVA